MSFNWSYFTLQWPRQILWLGVFKGNSWDLIFVDVSYDEWSFELKWRRGSSIVAHCDAGFQSIVDGKYEEMSTSELSGGARIHYIFQAIFVRSLEVIRTRALPCISWSIDTANMRCSDVPQINTLLLYFAIVTFCNKVKHSYQISNTFCKEVMPQLFNINKSSSQVFFSMMLLEHFNL